MLASQTWRYRCNMILYFFPEQSKENNRRGQEASMVLWYSHQRRCLRAPGSAGWSLVCSCSNPHICGTYQPGKGEEAALRPAYTYSYLGRQFSSVWHVATVQVWLTPAVLCLSPSLPTFLSFITAQPSNSRIKMPQNNRDRIKQLILCVHTLPMKVKQIRSMTAGQCFMHSLRSCLCSALMAS